MKIGLFFGSYNPVHVGHMVIANYLLEFTDLDNVWLVISPQNPFKQKASLLAQHHRLAVVQKAIGDHNRIKASDIEFKLPQPSYTINTLVHLKEKYPQHDFVLLLGSDNLETFRKWKNFEQIFEDYQLYVYPRKDSEGGEFRDHPKVTWVNAPYIEISSTLIRQAIKDKKDIRYFIPEAAYNYIREMHFYEK